MSSKNRYQVKIRRARYLLREKLLQIKRKGNRFRQKEPSENSTHLAPVKVQLGRGLDGKRLSFCSWNSEKHSSNSMRSLKAKMVWERRPTLESMLIRTLTGSSLGAVWGAVWGELGVDWYVWFIWCVGPWTWECVH